MNTPHGISNFVVLKVPKNLSSGLLPHSFLKNSVQAQRTQIADALRSTINILFSASTPSELRELYILCGIRVDMG